MVSTTVFEAVCLGSSPGTAAKFYESKVPRYACSADGSIPSGSASFMEGYLVGDTSGALKASGAYGPGVRFCHPSAKKFKILADDHRHSKGRTFRMQNGRNNARV